MNNEAILNKLVELGYLDMSERLAMDAMQVTHPTLVEVVIFDSCFSTLAAVCWKRKIELLIKNGQLLLTKDVPEERFGQEGWFTETVHEAPYSRQAIIEAFCKVTGVCDVL